MGKSDCLTSRRDNGDGVRGLVVALFSPCLTGRVRPRKLDAEVGGGVVANLVGQHPHTRGSVFVERNRVAAELHDFQNVASGLKVRRVVAGDVFDLCQFA